MVLPPSSAMATVATAVAVNVTVNLSTIANITGDLSEAVTNITADLSETITNFTGDLSAFANFTGNDTLPHDQTDQSDLYKVPALLVVVLSVLYGSISVIAVAGNGLVIWAIVTSKRMRSVTNHYLANLAFADILIALFAIPFEVSELPTPPPPTPSSP